MPRQVELDPHDELAFIVENAYHERLVAFLADSKENKKKKIDTNHRGPNGETYIIRCIQGAQKIDLSKSTAAESIKKFELCIKTLVENSFDVNAQDNAGRTPAHWCIIIQNSYLLRVLLLNGADHSIQDAEGQTALHLTIRLSFKDGIIAIGKSCPQAAFEVPSSQSGATPLIYGVQLGKTEIVQTLLEAGCNPNTPENNKFDASYVVGDYKGKTVLLRAAAHTDSRFLAMIIESLTYSGRGVEVAMEPNAETGMTPLMAACGAESTNNVYLLLEHTPAAVTGRDQKGRCALHYCSKNQELTCADSLCTVYPALVDVRDKSGVTPLLQAVLDGNVDLARYLMQRGADRDARDAEGHSAAHCACVSGQPQIVDLVSYANCELSSPDTYHAYPLHYAVRLSAEAGTVEQRRDAHKIINKLIAKGVPLNCVDAEGRQPVFWAAAGGDDKACMILYNAGADLNAKDRDGLTPLHVAAAKGHYRLIELLLSESNVEVDPQDNTGCTPLCYALTYHQTNCVELLLKHKANANAQDARGRSPAHCAAAGGFLQGLKLLQRFGADFHLRSAAGEMPVHEAVAAHHRPVVNYLLGVSDDTKDSKVREGKTALHAAVIEREVELVDLIVTAGANLNPVMYAADGTPQTPYDIAQRAKNKTIAEFLRQRGGTTAARVLNAAARTIQKYVREYLYKLELEREEDERVAAEDAATRAAERERLEQEEKARQEQIAYEAELAKRRVELERHYALEFESLRDGASDSDDDDELDAKISNFERRLREKLRQHSNAKASRPSTAARPKSSVSAATSAARRRPLRVFDGDQPPPPPAAMPVFRKPETYKPPKMPKKDVDHSSNLTASRMSDDDDEAASKKPPQASAPPSRRPSLPPQGAASSAPSEAAASARSQQQPSSGQQQATARDMREQSLANMRQSQTNLQQRMSEAPPPSYFVDPDDKNKSDAKAKRAAAKRRAPSAKRLDQVQKSVQLYEQTRCTMSAISALRRSQVVWANVPEEKLLNYFIRDFNKRQKKLPGAVLLHPPTPRAGSPASDTGGDPNKRAHFSQSQPSGDHRSMSSGARRSTGSGSTTQQQQQQQQQQFPTSETMSHASRRKTAAGGPTGGGTIVPPGETASSYGRQRSGSPHGTMMSKRDARGPDAAQTRRAGSPHGTMMSRGQAVARPSSPHGTMSRGPQLQRPGSPHGTMASRGLAAGRAGSPHGTQATRRSAFAEGSVRGRSTVGGSMSRAGSSYRRSSLGDERDENDIRTLDEWRAFLKVKLSEAKRMEAEYIRSTRPATAKTAADGSTVAAARSRPSTAHTAAANANAYSYSRPQTGRTAATGASASASRSRPQTTKSLRSGSGESGLGASASDGEQDGGAAGARRDGVGKLSQMQERTRQKAHVRHQLRESVAATRELFDENETLASEALAKAKQENNRIERNIRSVLEAEKNDAIERQALLPARRKMLRTALVSPRDTRDADVPSRRSNASTERPRTPKSYAPLDNLVGGGGGAGGSRPPELPVRAGNKYPLRNQPANQPSAAQQPTAALPAPPAKSALKKTSGSEAPPQQQLRTEAPNTQEEEINSEISADSLLSIRTSRPPAHKMAGWVPTFDGRYRRRHDFRIRMPDAYTRLREDTQQPSQEQSDRGSTAGYEDDFGPVAPVTPQPPPAGSRPQPAYSLHSTVRH